MKPPGPGVREQAGREALPISKTVETLKIQSRKILSRADRCGEVLAWRGSRLEEPADLVEIFSQSRLCLLSATWPCSSGLRRQCLRSF